MNWGVEGLNGHFWNVIDGELVDASRETPMFKALVTTHGAPRYLEAAPDVRDVWVRTCSRRQPDDPDWVVVWGECWLNARALQLQRGGEIRFGSLVFGEDWWGAREGKGGSPCQGAPDRKAVV